MYCGFYISLLGKPGSPLPEITEGNEPLVNAIYAWQHTFIADFPHDMTMEKSGTLQKLL